METFKGIIALDIDGTITVSKHSMEPPVYNYLNRLIKEEWRIILITGRTFSFAKPIASHLEGKYFLAPQNGAALFEMPQETCLFKRYLQSSVLQQLYPLSRAHDIGLLIESGKENGDICYYNPQDFPEKDSEYLSFREKISFAPWQKVNAVTTLPIQEFAVAKYFAPEAPAKELAEQITQNLNLNVIVIRDPFRVGYSLALVNAPDASKGKILEPFIRMHAQNLPIIAAGDDYNDLEMLEKSTVKIVMQGAPPPLLKIADIIAPPAEKNGIITALEEGIWKVSSK
jgi:HAD superfamily hydrolase (TIGR01484 family)